MPKTVFPIAWLACCAGSLLVAACAVPGAPVISGFLPAGFGARECRTSASPGLLADDPALLLAVTGAVLPGCRHDPGGRAEVRVDVAFARRDARVALDIPDNQGAASQGPQGPAKAGRGTVYTLRILARAADSGAVLADVQATQRLARPLTRVEERNLALQLALNLTRLAGRTAPVASPPASTVPVQAR